MMKFKRGSSLIVVLAILSGLSTLLLYMQHRSSLLLLTVIEREKALKTRYAAHALMLYAVKLAQLNWEHIYKQISNDPGKPLQLDPFSWSVDNNREAEAHIFFKNAINNRMQVVIALTNEDITQSLQAHIEPQGDNFEHLLMSGWKEL